MLDRGEVAADELAEYTTQSSRGGAIGFRDVAHALYGLSRERGRPFSHLVFFPIHAQTTRDSIVAIVREFARLADSVDALDNVRVNALSGGELIFAREAEFPEPNATVEFDLRGEHVSTSFVIYESNLPIGLFDELARVFNRAVPAKRFVGAYCDLQVIALIDNECVPMLERHFPDEFEPYAA